MRSFSYGARRIMLAENVSTSEHSTYTTRLFCKRPHSRQTGPGPGNLPLTCEHRSRISYLDQFGKTEQSSREERTVSSSGTDVMDGSSDSTDGTREEQTTSSQKTMSDTDNVLSDWKIEFKKFKEAIDNKVEIVTLNDDCELENMDGLDVEAAKNELEETRKQVAKCNEELRDCRKKVSEQEQVILSCMAQRIDARMEMRSTMKEIAKIEQRLEEARSTFAMNMKCKAEYMAREERYHNELNECRTERRDAVAKSNFCILNDVENFLVNLEAPKARMNEVSNKLMCVKKSRSNVEASLASVTYDLLVLNWSLTDLVTVLTDAEQEIKTLSTALVLAKEFLEQTKRRQADAEHKMESLLASECMLMKKLGSARNENKCYDESPRVKEEYLVLKCIDEQVDDDNDELEPIDEEILLCRKERILKFVNDTMKSLENTDDERKTIESMDSGRDQTFTDEAATGENKSLSNRKRTQRDRTDSGPVTKKNEAKKNEESIEALQLRIKELGKALRDQEESSVANQRKLEERVEAACAREEEYETKMRKMEAKIAESKKVEVELVRRVKLARRYRPIE